jgi:hypothetical protein
MFVVDKGDMLAQEKASVTQFPDASSVFNEDQT